MRSKFCGLSLTVLALLLGAWTTPAQAEEVLEFIDVPNRIAWLPAGSEFVMRFLISITDGMLGQYRLVLERIRALRAQLATYPPAYDSVTMFYDNDIQHPSDNPSHKPPHNPSPYKKSTDEAFKAAFETIKKFANRRVPPIVKH